MCHAYDYETEDLSERGDLRVEDLDELLPDEERDTETEEEDAEPVTPPADD